MQLEKSHGRLDCDQNDELDQFGHFIVVSELGFGGSGGAPHRRASPALHMRFQGPDWKELLFDAPPSIHLPEGECRH